MNDDKSNNSMGDYRQDVNLEDNIVIKQKKKNRFDDEEEDFFNENISGVDIETIPMENDEDEVPTQEKRKGWNRFDDDDEEEEDKYSENYTVDIESLNQFAPREEVISDPDQFVGYTIQKIFELGAQHKIVRTLIFFVVHFRLCAEQYEGMRETLKRIRRASYLHRDTIHKYISIAKVESQLGINNGIMSVQALMSLYRCDPTTRGEIMEIAIKYQLEDEAEYKAKPKRGKAKRFARKPKPYPGLKHVDLAVKHYTLLKQFRDELIENGEDPRDAEVKLALPKSKAKSKKDGRANKNKINPVDRWSEDVTNEDYRDIEESMHFKSLRVKEKFLQNFGFFLKRGTISQKKIVLRQLTVRKKQDVTTYHVNRILAYHDQHKINQIIADLKADIKNAE